MNTWVSRNPGEKDTREYKRRRIKRKTGEEGIHHEIENPGEEGYQEIKRIRIPGNTGEEG